MNKFDRKLSEIQKEAANWRPLLNIFRHGADDVARYAASGADDVGRLIAGGTDDFLRAGATYGDDFLRAGATYGDDFLRAGTTYGDDLARMGGSGVDDALRNAKKVVVPKAPPKPQPWTRANRPQQPWKHVGDDALRNAKKVTPKAPPKPQPGGTQYSSQIGPNPPPPNASNTMGGAGQYPSQIGPNPPPPPPSGGGSINDKLREVLGYGGLGVKQVGGSIGDDLGRAAKGLGRAGRKAGNLGAAGGKKVLGGTKNLGRKIVSQTPQQQLAKELSKQPKNMVKIQNKIQNLQAGKASALESGNQILAKSYDTQIKLLSKQFDTQRKAWTKQVLDLRKQNQSLGNKLFAQRTKAFKKITPQTDAAATAGTTDAAATAGTTGTAATGNISETWKKFRQTGWGGLTPQEQRQMMIWGGGGLLAKGPVFRTLGID